MINISVYKDKISQVTIMLLQNNYIILIVNGNMHFTDC